MIDFKNVYNQKDLLSYLNEYLPNFEPQKEELQLNKKCKYIKSVVQLGKSKKLDLNVYEIDHISENDPRVTLSKEAFSILREYIARKSLVVFKNESTQNYRLSLITFQSTWESGNKIKTEFSNPRRYSFFLGPDAKVKTPTRFLIEKGKLIDFEDLKKRFSLEVVNKEFYKDISEQFIKLVGGSLNKGKKKIEYLPLLKLPSISDKSQITVEFAVRLIGRVIFCWFLREKKSLNRKALVPKDLLSYEAIGENIDYYHKILEPIFFEVLNKQVKLRREDFVNDLFSSIPYLNGGLFSPHEDDYYRRNNGDFQSQYHNTLIIPDAWFIEFFQVLETYNFTIDENTSFDEELSIDPEMLGRIFENLLAEINPETGESARKSTGSYYTPRVIVDYMVDESLLLYLKEQTKMEEKKLRAIISYDLDDDVDNPITDNERQKIVDALEKVKILDPACGSGAFPIGALQKIVFILQQIDPHGKLWREKQLAKADPEFRKDIEKRFSHKEYDFIRKLGIIRDCIYGIDIQPIATEISRLRCFLTLIVDEQVDDIAENRGIKPLPNLDFKFVTANSLIGLPKIDEPQGSMFDDYQKINELKKIRDEYFNASGLEREQLKTQFVSQQKLLFKDLQKEHGWQGVSKAELTNKLTDWDPFTHKSTPWFDPEWMFGIKGGFNIIIANPPYKILTKNNISKEDHDYYTKHYNAIKLSNSKNLFTLFIEISMRLLDSRAILSYIVPEGLFKTRSYIPCVDLMKKEGEIKSVITFTDYVFENAVTGNLIFIFKKGWKGDTSYFHFNGAYVISKTIIEENKVLTKMENNSVTLNSIATLFKGMVVRDRDKVLFEDKNNYKNIFLLGKNMSKWKIIPKYYTDYNMLQIVGGTKKLDKHNQVPRILIRRTGNSLCCAYLMERALTESTLYSCWPNTPNYSDKYLIGLLNSKLLNYYNKIKFITNQQGFPQILMTDLELMPIKAIPIAEQNALIKVVDCVLSITNNNDYAKDSTKLKKVLECEKIIDQMVYKLYGLTEEEIDIVEGIN